MHSFETDISSILRVFAPRTEDSLGASSSPMTEPFPSLHPQFAIVREPPCRTPVRNQVRSSEQNQMDRWCFDARGCINRQRREGVCACERGRAFGFVLLVA